MAVMCYVRSQAAVCRGAVVMNGRENIVMNFTAHRFEPKQLQSMVGTTFPNIMRRFLIKMASKIGKVVQTDKIVQTMGDPSATTFTTSPWSAPPSLCSSRGCRYNQPMSGTPSLCSCSTCRYNQPMSGTPSLCSCSTCRYNQPMSGTPSLCSCSTCRYNQPMSGTPIVMHPQYAPFLCPASMHHSYAPTSMQLQSMLGSRIMMHPQYAFLCIIIMHSQYAFLCPISMHLQSWLAPLYFAPSCFTLVMHQQYAYPAECLFALKRSNL